MSITVMKQALEDLNTYQVLSCIGGGAYDPECADLKVAAAMDKLSQAIEQAEKVEPVGIVCHELWGKFVADITGKVAEGDKLYLHPPTAPMRESAHPMAQRCWSAACHIQEMLTATDPENSLAELDVDDTPPTAPAQPSPFDVALVDRLVEQAQQPLTEQAWECNECGSQEYASILSEHEVHELGCGKCGSSEWHLADIKGASL